MFIAAFSRVAIWRENRVTLGNGLWIFKESIAAGLLMWVTRRELFKSQIAGMGCLDLKINKHKMPFVSIYKRNGWFCCNSLKAMNWKSSVFSSGYLMHTPSLHSPQNYSTRGSSWVFPLNFNKSIFTNELTFKKKRFIYLLAVLGFPCCVGFSLIAANEGYSSLRCAGFSLQWLLLSRNTGSRCSGFSSCSLWAQ